MGEFSTYLLLGFEHISDLRGYDHMLFIITLCAIYRLTEWKQLLILVSAFTVGHSITLALSALDIVRVPDQLIELLIPITIFITSIYNIFARRDDPKQFRRTIYFNYAIALFFGFIHGMGFSNYFRALMMDASDVVFPLFSFNVGIELGQIAIVLIFFAFYWMLSRFFTIRQREWTLFISGAGGGVALILILEKVLEILS